MRSKRTLCVQKAPALAKGALPQKKHRLWLTALTPDARKKPGKPKGLPGFLHALSPKPPGQSCAPPRKRQLLMQDRKAFRRLLWGCQGKPKRLCAKTAFQG